MHDKNVRALQALEATVAALVSPDGCPWDRAQTLESLAPCIVEEAWELLDAVRRGDTPNTREELGDVLMLVMLMCAVGARGDRLDLAQVSDGVREKLVRRHPHVFGDIQVADAREVKANWEAIKRQEGAAESDDGLPALPAALPSLTQAQRLGKAASKQGFDWPDLGGPLAKISEEWGELKTAVAGNCPKEIEHEVGDMLFAVTNLCRFLDVDAETALRAACVRFRRRFRHVRDGVDGSERADLAAMERLWEQAKAQEGDTG